MSDQFYLQDSRGYVGNDISWWAKNGGYTCDISKAHVFDREEALRLHKSRISDVPWPKAYVDAKTRPVVDMQVVRIEDALRGTGVRLIKPKRVRPTTGKHRSNCPECGRIVWDHNPYEAILCKKCE